jgi:hypothetical protein
LEALRARVREEERGGTLPGGMLYILDMLLLSAGLGGDGVLEDRPRWTNLMPLLSRLVFLSGSLFSPQRFPILGRRLEATEGCRERSGRDVLRDCLSGRGLRSRGSARLGSVSSRISDRGRIFVHEETLMECPLSSPKLLPTMPPRPMTGLPSDPGDVRKETPLSLSNEGPR